MEISNQTEIICNKKIVMDLSSLSWNLNLRTYIFINMLLQIFWKTGIPVKPSYVNIVYYCLYLHLKFSTHKVINQLV